MVSVNLLIVTLGGGGAERVVAELYSSHPADILTRLAIFSSKINAYTVDSNNLTILSSEFCKTKLLKLIYSIRPRIIYCIIRYTLYLRRNKADVSVSFLTDMNITNIISCLLTHTKCLVSVRNNPNSDYSGIYGYILLNSSLFFTRFFADHVIVNSQGSRQVLIQKYHINPDKVSVIYNPKDIQKIEKLKNEVVTESFFQTGEPVLMTAGRLFPQKGHVHLIRIFAELRKTYPCKLAICGVGPLEKQLKQLVHDLQIGGDVLFLGWCDNVYKYMAGSTVFVLPSLYEGQPNALIEALICGCPIVSTDCDFGPREILEDGKYGILCKKLEGEMSNNFLTPLTPAEEDMYVKIKLLLDEPDLRKSFSDKSNERSLVFEKEKTIKEYYDIFKKVCNTE